MSQTDYDHAASRLADRREARALARAAAGIPIHLVGGAVRDALSGLDPHDFDAVVERGAAAVADRLAAILGGRLVALGGDRFAAYRLVTDESELDLWDRESAPLEEDLRRRDFTVNAMAVELPGGRLVDPLGGLGDLRAGQLRATSQRVLAEDPLRVLRLARLAAEHPGLTPDSATLEWSRAAASAIGQVSGERIREELTRLFAAPGVLRATEHLAAVGLYPGLWLDQPGAAGSPLLLVAACERLESIADAQAPSLEDSDWNLDLPFVRAALAIRLAPRESQNESAGTTGGTASGNLEASNAALERFRERRYLAGKTADAIGRVLALGPLPRSERELCAFAHRAGGRWLDALVFLQCQEPFGSQEPAASDHQPLSSAARNLLRLMRDRGPTILEPPVLLRGDEASEILGVPPGPELGRALAALRTEQVAGALSTREQAEKFLALWRDQ